MSLEFTFKNIDRVAGSNVNGIRLGIQKFMTKLKCICRRLCYAERESQRRDWILFAAKTCVGKTGVLVWTSTRTGML